MSPIFSTGYPKGYYHVQLLSVSKSISSHESFFTDHFHVENRYRNQVDYNANATAPVIEGAEPYIFLPPEGRVFLHFRLQNVSPTSGVYLSGHLKRYRQTREFVTAEGNTVAIFTLKEDDVRPLHGREILHVREMSQTMNA